MDEQELTTRIQSSYPGAVIDISGENCSFEVFIISDEFRGLRNLQRQQAILGLFSLELKTGKLHALSLTIKTPDEHSQSLNAGLIQIKL